KVSETSNTGKMIGDYGVDFIIINQNGDIKVQVKNWERTIGTEELMKMIGIVSETPGSKAMIISKSGFTKKAYEEAGKRKDIILVKGLEEIWEKYRQISEIKIGTYIRKRTVEIERATSLEMRDLQ